MAGTATLVHNQGLRDGPTLIGSPMKLCWNVTSDGSGDVSGGDTADAVFGIVTGFHVVPSAVDQPTDGFVVKINDANGLDVTIGAGASCSNDPTNTGLRETPITSNGGLVVLHNATLTVVCSGMGSAKKATINLYVHP